MPSAKIAHLTDRALIRITGDDAHHFLQNLVTADVEETDANGASSTALLTPQGKILFDFLLYRTDGGYIADAPALAAADLLKRLTFYRLRAKVVLEPLDAATGVFAVWDGPLEIEGALVAVIDPRTPLLGQRIIAPVAAMDGLAGATEADLNDYERHRIATGVPEGLKDYAYSDIFPHDADLDQLGGVSFTKGCYVGQEVVSRVQHRGTARKRFVLVDGDRALPEKGTPVTAQGKSIGELGSSIASEMGESVGLALLRLDKVAQAEDNGSPLNCGDVEIEVRIPDWANFSLPNQNDPD